MCSWVMVAGCMQMAFFANEIKLVYDEKEKKMVQLLQQDHIKILKKLEEFMEQVASYGPHPTEKEIEKIMTSSRALLEMVLLHARKEDTCLFPNL